jgi:phosphoglycerate dehydrogenase-like enzyme
VIPKVFISTPLESEIVARIQHAVVGRAEIVFEPELLPPVRYTADHKGVDRFVRQGPTLRRWEQCLAEADFLWDIPPLHMLPSNDLSWARKLKWVQTTSSGVGPLVETLGFKEAGIKVTTARGVHSGPLSEFVLMALLIHFRGLRYLESEQRTTRWTRYCGDSLEGKTIAVIGTGEVGHRVAEVCQFLGMRILAMSRSLTEEEAAARGYSEIFSRCDLDKMAAKSDAMVLCVPESAHTVNMIDRSIFSAMKRGAVLVNVARGSVVDESAMIDALEAGTVGFAALDVTATEPLPASSRLWTHPNVLISPHSASTVARENSLIADIFIHNLQCMLDERWDEMKNVLDLTKL